MGLNGSSLRGGARIHENLLPYSSWQKKDIEHLYDRHQHETRGAFALSLKKLCVMTGLSEESGGKVFSLLDTDHNGLVDAFEALIAFCLVAQMKLTDKMNFVFGLYNFSGNGELNVDELIILIRTVAHAAAKIDSRVAMLRTDEAEALAMSFFRRFERDVEEELRKWEFDSFCLSQPSVAGFLSFWAHLVNQVALPEGAGFSDFSFPAAHSSLYFNVDLAPPGMIPASCVRWRRPDKIFGGHAQLFDDDFRLFGTLQMGAIGHAWFVSALALAATKPELIRRMFCHTGQEEQGRFCVQFFKGSVRIPVVVDDHLPCDPTGSPLFCKGAESSAQVWPSLVEKAYAKLHGCYESIIGGRIETALRDVTGGLVRRIPFEEVTQKHADAEEAAADEIWTMLVDGLREGLVGLLSGIREGSREPTAAMTEGITQGTLYVVDRVESLRGKRLLRLKYPYLPMRPYTGDWGWHSSTWQSFKEVAADLQMDEEGISGQEEGFFWMDLESCVALFNTMYQVFVEHELADWFTVVRSGSWSMQNGTAAGCIANPGWRAGEQLFLEVFEPGKVLLCLSQSDSSGSLQSSCTASICPTSSTYEPRLSSLDEDLQQGKEAAIGILIFRHDFDGVETLKRLDSVDKDDLVSGHVKMLPERDAMLVVTMKPGKYVILVSTFAPNVERDWHLTLHSARPVTLFSERETFAPPEKDAELEEDEESTSFAASMEEGTFRDMHLDEVETSCAVALEHLARVYDALSDRIFDLNEELKKRLAQAQDLKRLRECSRPSDPD
eukprot:scaffold263_cov251-Pinguiococcus_pyrenoidosus.AAC.5